MSSHYDLYVVGRQQQQLSGEDLSRYLNKIESVGVRKCPYYH